MRCMSFKGSKTISDHNSNSQYIEILDNFLIPSIENWFGNDEVILRNDNGSCHRTKEIKTFHQERHTKSMIWQSNFPDLNSMKDFVWNWFLKWSMIRLYPPKKIYLLSFRKVGTTLIKNIALNYWNPWLKELRFHPSKKVYLLSFREVGTTLIKNIALNCRNLLEKKLSLHPSRKIY